VRETVLQKLCYMKPTAALAEISDSQGQRQHQSH
jgi:hypothetical protein